MELRRYSKTEFVRIVFALLAVIGLSACLITSWSLPAPEQLIQAGRDQTDLDLDSLRRGRALAMTECIDCHRFFWPEEYTEQEWGKIVRRMAILSALSREQTEDLEHYLVAAAQAAKSSQGQNPSKR